MKIIGAAIAYVFWRWLWKWRHEGANRWIVDTPRRRYVFLQYKRAGRVLSQALAAPRT